MGTHDFPLRAEPRQEDGAVGSFYADHLAYFEHLSAIRATFQRLLLVRRWNFKVIRLFAKENMGQGGRARIVYRFRLIAPERSFRLRVR